MIETNPYWYYYKDRITLKYLLLYPIKENIAIVADYYLKVLVWFVLFIEFFKDIGDCLGAIPIPRFTLVL